MSWVADGAELTMWPLLCIGPVRCHTYIAARVDKLEQASMMRSMC